MGYYYGYQGSVKFNATGGSATSIAKVTDWTITIDKQVKDVTRVNETYIRQIGGIISGAGSLSLLYTGDNVALIEAINTPSDTGNALFELYLSETDSKRIVFNGLITKATYSANRDEIATVTCEFVTTGAITLDL
jgi:hypothetical protein